MKGSASAPPAAPIRWTSARDQGAVTCGTDGTCDGAGACRFYAGATVCAPAVCTGAMATPTRTCNGAGVCLIGLPVSCSPYACGDRRRVPDQLRQRRRLPGAQRLHRHDVRAAGDGRRGWRRGRRRRAAAAAGGAAGRRRGGTARRRGRRRAVGGRRARRRAGTAARRRGGGAARGGAAGTGGARAPAARRARAARRAAAAGGARAPAARRARWTGGARAPAARRARRGRRRGLPGLRVLRRLRGRQRGRLDAERRHLVGDHRRQPRLPGRQRHRRCRSPARPAWTDQT